MKLLLRACLSLLAVLPALCWPVEDDALNYDQQGGGLATEMESLYNGVGDGIGTEMPKTLQQHFNYYAESQDEEPQLPANVAEEIRKQYEEVEQMTQKYEYFAEEQAEEPTLPSDVSDEIKKELEATPGGELALAQTKSSARVLRQGCRVAFQLLFNHLWLGCSGSYCTGASCPGRLFEGAEASKCWGEVFQLFRVRGKGNLVSGDFVGIYYPREKRWFSMIGGRGHKEPCPGYPTSTYGFQSLHHWFYCGGEVFQVFAQGKSNGAVITDQDNLVFYYPCGNRFLSFQPGHTVLTGCINSRFPSSVHYDRCLWESVEITIID